MLPPHTVPQGGSEKLGDEDLEAVLDKVVRMLAYISGEQSWPGSRRRHMRSWPAAHVHLERSAQPLGRESL
jgi:hypothetical protein